MPYVVSQRCIPLHYFRAEMPQIFAIGVDQQAAVIPASDADILRVIGYLQLQHGKLEQAIVMFDALHALFPDDLNAGLSLAFSYLQLGHVDESSEVLDQIESRAGISTRLSMPQKNPCFCWLRSHALLAAGQSVEAARWMRLFLRLRRQSIL